MPITLILRIVFFLSLVILDVGCVGIPNNIQAVGNFNAERYLGTWYEIARLDNPFETGLEKISAQYSLKEDGGLRVLNRGYDPNNNHWKEAEGKGYFVGTTSEGRLKVSFFGPFYGAYNIISLDNDYSYSLVCGSDLSYLWILSRKPQMPETVLNQLISKAKSFGFDTDKLIFVKQ